MTVETLAQHIIKSIEEYDEFGVEVIGNLHQIVHCLGIGTGACTDVIQMYIRISILLSQRRWHQ